MTHEFMITDNAQKQIRKILASEQEGSFFRIAVKGGGCSGFSYEFIVDHKKEADDHIYNCNDFDVIIDDVSIAFVKNAQLDYVTALIGSQFEIKNPNAKSSCGCGVSFSV